MSQRNGETLRVMHPKFVSLMKAEFPVLILLPASRTTDKAMVIYAALSHWLFSTKALRDICCGACEGGVRAVSRCFTMACPCYLDTDKVINT